MMVRYGSALVLVLLVTASLGAGVHAQEERESFDRDMVEVALGGSTMMRLRGSVGKVIMTDPTVADVTTVGGQVLLVGRRVGETNLILSSGGRHTTYVVRVALPARAIQAELARTFPNEEIVVRAVGGSLVLNGVVSNSHIPGQAEDVAIGYLRSPSIAALGVKPHVINLLRVRAKQQVMLEVKFAEVNRGSAREMGLNAFGKKEDGRLAFAVGRRMNNEVGYSKETSPPWPPHVSTVPYSAFFTGNNTVGSIFVSNPTGGFPFAATLNLLSTQDMAKTLAEPNLIALSGQTATFLAGGEVPVPVSNGFSTTVEFKKFGIELSFTPTVGPEETIHLTTKAAVSAPDPTLAVVVNNVATAGFKRRSTETTVRLRDGQSFAIAGLLSDEMENLMEKVPGLGDLPVLGIFFSSKQFDRRETELIVVVTARLVEPMDSTEVPPLPGTDRASDPTDLELFFLNIPDPDRPPSGPQKASPGRLRGRRRPAGKIGFWR